MLMNLILESFVVIIAKLEFKNYMPVTFSPFECFPCLFLQEI